MIKAIYIYVLCIYINTHLEQMINYVL